VLVQFGPNGKVCEVPTGTSLLAAANRAGMPLGQSCRGQGVCNSCRVRVDAGKARLSAPTPLERRWRLEPPWRLACQTRVTDGPDEVIVALGCPAWGG
jgi:ferredoxin